MLGIIEEAILHLTDKCDGAASQDGQGWNKFDANFGRSISENIRSGRSLTHKQRKVINRIIRKYKNQFSNWEQIHQELIPWVNAAPQKDKKKEGPPKLFLYKGYFYLRTPYAQRQLAKRLPRGRWLPDKKLWRYTTHPDVVQEAYNLYRGGFIKELNSYATQYFKEYEQELRKKASSIQKATGIKSGEDYSLDIPLKTEPFEHQRQAMKVGTLLDSTALLMEQGTGKTLAAIGIATHRYLQGQVKRLLIVAPKSVLPEWARQFEEHTDLNYQAVPLDVPGKKKIEILENWEDVEGINVVTINYESTWRIQKELTRWKPDMVILDESQNIKNGTTKQSKACRALGKVAKYRLILTGTPVSEKPLDFFGQYQFLDPTIFGNSFTRFRDRYARMGGFGGYQILGYQNLEELSKKAHSISYRITKEEALDLPEEITQHLETDLDPKTRKAYREMEEHSLLDLGEDKQISAPIILTQLLRLQQIAGGFIKDEETEEVIPVGTAKLNLWKETTGGLLDAGKKLVVFAKFTAEIEAMSDHLEEQGIKHVTLTGATKNRQHVISSFQKDPETKVLIAQISTGGVGITLTAADTAIFYSTGYSLIDYEQAKARIHRIGQTKKVTYIHIVAKNTIDEVIVNALREKKDLAKLAVDDYRQAIKIRGGNKMSSNLDEKLASLKSQIKESEEPEVEIDENEELEEKVEPVVEEETPEVEEAPEDEIEEEVGEEVEEEAPKKGKRRRKTKKTKKDAPKKKQAAAKEPKDTEAKEIPRKEKKAVKEDDTDSVEVVKIGDLAEELGVTPATLRKKLRNEGFEKPSGRWEWPEGHPDLEAIREGSEDEEE